LLNNNLVIANKTIGTETSPYIIAEIGSNFDKDFDKALRLIDVAAEAGADAVKFQLFRANKLYPNGGELYDIFKSIELDPNWVPKLRDHASSRNVHFMASAFDFDSLNVLEDAKVPAHKIASSETTNLGFLHQIAKTQKPLIISTGMCDFVDVLEAVNTCIAAGNRNIALMQCGALYPLPIDLSNLNVIRSFSAQFGCPVGFSDHTTGHVAASTAIGLGACIFEKHITLDRSSAGPDHFYALEPEDLKAYIETIRQSHQALGSFDKEMLPKEREIGRREGLYFSRSLKSGETISSSDIEIKRPALGLRSRYSNSIVGAKLSKDVEKDQPITWEAIIFGDLK